MEAKIDNIGKLLCNTERPLKERFRALFTLRNLGGKKAIDWISKAFSDDSALLKHECAYCLGQMNDPYANPKLVEILGDYSQEPMVRHEAGEALGAIGSLESLEVLEKYLNDPSPEVAETCQLAIQKIKWEQAGKKEEAESLVPNPYNSIDPAPPLPASNNDDVPKLQEILVDESYPLFKRYRAMFALRNLGTKEAILALAKGLHCPGSALFRHEVAYVLGQIQSEDSQEALAEVLADTEENCMVRHECAEAMGSIGSSHCNSILQHYLTPDTDRVVRESCLVALDISDYNNSPEFQYADSLRKV